jgi:hypothetical protein
MPQAKQATVPDLWFDNCLADIKRIDKWRTYQNKPMGFDKESRIRFTTRLVGAVIARASRFSIACPFRACKASPGLTCGRLDAQASVG